MLIFLSGANKENTPPAQSNGFGKSANPNGKAPALGELSAQPSTSEEGIKSTQTHGKAPVLSDVLKRKTQVRILKTRLSQTRSF